MQTQGWRERNLFLRTGKVRTVPGHRSQHLQSQTRPKAHRRKPDHLFHVGQRRAGVALPGHRRPPPWQTDEYRAKTILEKIFPQGYYRASNRGQNGYLKIRYNDIREFNETAMSYRRASEGCSSTWVFCATWRSKGQSPTGTSPAAWPNCLSSNKMAQTSGTRPTPGITRNWRSSRRVRWSTSAHPIHHPPTGRLHR